MIHSIGDRTLLFMHIAKTGGTSLRETLAQAYTSEERLHVYDPADLRGAVSVDGFAELPEERRQKLRLVIGHYQYGLHRTLGRPFAYVAVIRDPVDRVASLYYHYMHLGGLRRGGKARAERALIRRNRLSLEEWVFGQQRLAVDNGMTRNLAARRRVRFGECPDDLLDEALDHVDRHFIMLLVTDELARSRELLGRVTGRRIEEVKRTNANKDRPSLDELDPRMLGRIRELNRLDQRLYEVAMERFGALLDGDPREADGDSDSVLR